MSIDTVSPTQAKEAEAKAKKAAKKKAQAVSCEGEETFFALEMCISPLLGQEEGRRCSARRGRSGPQRRALDCAVFPITRRCLRHLNRTYCCFSADRG